jgi:hypothetical protein
MSGVSCQSTAGRGRGGRRRHAVFCFFRDDVFLMNRLGKLGKLEKPARVNSNDKLWSFNSDVVSHSPPGEPCMSFALLRPRILHISRRRLTTQFPRTMSTDTSTMSARVAELGTLIKSLKASSQSFQSELQEMLSLKQQLNPNSASSSTGVAKLTLKTPKGTKDQGPSATLLRQKIFDSLAEIFKKHGGMSIDTPVFELKEILSGK